MSSYTALEGKVIQMERKPGRVLVRGTSLLVRTGSRPRAGKTFFPPDAIINEYAQFADKHGSRVLWTMGPMNMATLEDVTSVIVYSADSGDALIGRIVGAGRGYDPAAWGSGSDGDDAGFLAPEPWASNPAASWIALDRVRVGHILLSDYRPARGGRDLKDLMKGSGGGKVLIDCIRD